MSNNQALLTFLDAIMFKGAVPKSDAKEDDHSTTHTPTGADFSHDT